MKLKDVNKIKLNKGEYCRKGSSGCFCKEGWPREEQCPNCREETDDRDSYCVCPPPDYKKPRIIAFCAAKQAGKSTAVEVLKKNYPNVIDLMLAGKLKDVCSQVFGFTRESMEDGKLKEKELDPPICLTKESLEKVMLGYKEDFDFYGLSYSYDKHVREHVGHICYTRRQLLQYIGTEVLKQIDPDIHCRVLARKIQEGEIYTISDMRFPDEFNFFNDSKYLLNAYYVKNDKAEAKAMSDPHPSERLVLKTAQKCAILSNNGTLEDFKRLVLEELKGILK